MRNTYFLEPSDGDQRLRDPDEPFFKGGGDEGQKIRGGGIDGT